MHMADALISPVVGGAMLAAAAVTGAYSIRKTQEELDEKKIPLMGVMGAFVFAAQMINFSIPGTGSSGHLGGGMLLAILLGPYAGFLTMASILLIQALFFGDGGLLAYGCNVINLGFYTCFVTYPLIYRWITIKGLKPGRIFGASMISAVAGLQLGAFSVALQTFLSGRTELPFGTFVLFMQPIHLAIGVVEGLVTAAVVSFIWRAKPEILEKSASGETLEGVSIKKVFIVFIIAALLVGGVFSWYASSDPDGLEWSVEKTAGSLELEAQGGIHNVLARLQGMTAILPDYGFKTGKEEKIQEPEGIGAATEVLSSDKAGTSISGMVGGLIILVFAALTGYIIKLVKKRKRKPFA